MGVASRRTAHLHGGPGHDRRVAIVGLPPRITLDVAATPELAAIARGEVRPRDAQTHVDTWPETYVPAPACHDGGVCYTYAESTGTPLSTSVE